LGIIGLAEALPELNPDILVLLGDRFETLAAAVAATVNRIPIAHIHGGESTEGAMDEAFRHAITKMSHVHFTAVKVYGQRVIRMGEDPARVFVVGALGNDWLDKMPLLDRKDLERSLDFELGERNLLVTFHPVTLEQGSSERQFQNLLDALDLFPEIRLIFTRPNADTEGRVLIPMIEAFVEMCGGRAAAFASLGRLRYLSALQCVDGVVGNSSSGLIEAPSLRTGTVNIGDRQKGRLKAASVIDCDPETASIAGAIRRLYSPSFRALIETVTNPYGEGGTAQKIAEVLKQVELADILKKSFHDPTDTP
jgi:GDP/UDP-N,N'-diacetylbacillosamine 2-epimerase (hydrolysing)